jgi:hypothetical protein
MLKNSGTHVRKQRLSWLNYSELSTVLENIIATMRIKDEFNPNLNQTYKQFVPTLNSPIYIRQCGYFSPQYTAPITITTKFI